MAKKGCISVDVKKENPLLTIIKAGKIPVVRLSDKGFQNYKQKGYFENHNSGIHKDDYEKCQKGCFVSLLGVQGNYVCGSHYGEAIHIGYIEPNDIVFSTHTYHKKKDDYCYQTAKERFDSAILSYNEYWKEVEERGCDPDDYDIYSEAIVDTKKIRKVMVIDAKDYGSIVPYCNDGMYKIFRDEILFCHLIWENCLSEELMNHMSWVVKDEHHLYYKDKEVYDMMDNSYYKKLILEEFVNFYTVGKFLRDEEFYITLQEKLIKYAEMMKPYQNDYFNTGGLALNYFNEKEIRLYCTKDEWREKWSVSAVTSDDTVSLSVIKTMNYASKDRSKADIFKFNEDNILSDKFRHILYKLVEMKNIFEKCFGDLIHIEYPKWMGKLEAFYNLENAIAEWHPITYSYNEKNCELTFSAGYGEYFKFVYNIVLCDGIVEIDTENGAEYYNTDNLPKDYNTFWLDIVLELLKNWEAQFFFVKIKIIKNIL